VPKVVLKANDGQGRNYQAVEEASPLRETKRPETENKEEIQTSEPIIQSGNPQMARVIRRNKYFPRITRVFFYNISILRLSDGENSELKMGRNMLQ